MRTYAQCRVFQAQISRLKSDGLRTCLARFCPNGHGDAWPQAKCLATLPTRGAIDR